MRDFQSFISLSFFSPHVDAEPPLKIFNLRVFLSRLGAEYERLLEHDVSKSSFLLVYMAIDPMKIYNLRVFISSMRVEYVKLSENDLSKPPFLRICDEQPQEDI